MSMPDVSGVGLAAPQSSRHTLLEVTFTLTATGLCAQESLTWLKPGFAVHALLRVVFHPGS